jgi:hypothetical protein
MKKISFLLSAFILFSGIVAAQTKEEVISKIWEGAGGKKNWQDSRFITFVFAPEKDGKVLLRRSHLWDRTTGNYRFETKTGKNETLLVLFNVNSLKGRSFINGRPLVDSLNTIQIKKANNFFINDSYWLLAHLRLEEPGVKVLLEEPEEIDGRLCQVLYVNAEKVSQNAGDQCWLYVDPDNGQIKRWKLLAEGQKEAGIFNWTNLKDLGGGLKLSTRKQNINQNNAITFPVASVLISVEPEKFSKK